MAQAKLITWQEKGLSMVEGKGERILIVEDEPAIRQLVERVLGRAGYQVRSAAHGGEAFALLEKEPFDLIITDLNMPEMDGHQLLEQCRVFYPDIDVMILTADTTLDTAVAMLKQGAVDYLTKPFTRRELREKVAECLQARKLRELEQRMPARPLLALNRILSTANPLATTLGAVQDLLQRTFHPTSTELHLLAGPPDLAHKRWGPPVQGHVQLDVKNVRLLSERPEPWLLGDAHDPPKDRSKPRGFCLAVPLLGNHRVVGVLSLVRQPPLPRFTRADAELLHIFGSLLAVSLLHLSAQERIADAFSQVTDANPDTVRALFEALGIFDQYTRDHSRRVAEYAVQLGQRLGLDQESLRLLYLGGLFHDIGKLGVGDSTLNKNGSLTLEEFDRVKLHPSMGARILEGVEAFAQVVPIVLYHHEAYNGTGYPEGLKGEQIPLLARIVAVVDAYDSMMTDRPYRSALSRQQVLRELQAGAGKQFDPRLVEEWVAVVQAQSEELVHG